MKMFLISDNRDTLTGLRLVGVNGVIVHDRFDFKAEIDKVWRVKDIGIVVVSEDLAAKYPEVIEEFRQERRVPLIVQIPGRHGSARGEDFISRYVREAIGMKL